MKITKIQKLTCSFCKRDYDQVEAHLEDGTTVMMCDSAAETKLWNGTKLVICDDCLDSLMRGVAESPDFARFPGVPKALRPFPRPASPWREAIWWLLHPKGGEAWAVLPRPTFESGLQFCSESILHGPGNWYSDFVCPQYPHSRVLSTARPKSDSANSLFADLETVDPLDKVSKYYRTWGEDHNWQLNNINDSGSNRFSCRKSGVLLEFWLCPDDAFHKTRVSIKQSTTTVP